MGEPDASRLLADLRAGAQPTPEMMSALYADLRGMAARMMRGERGDHTLQPTALVHEAFLRLADKEDPGEFGRLRFLEAAAVTMRRVLVDHARRAGRQKRGGEWRRVTLSGVEEDTTVPGGVDVLALHEALRRLERLDARQARIVELRFFSGMNGQEIAEHLSISRNTVVRELTLSRAWLKREMGEIS